MAKTPSRPSSTISTESDGVARFGSGRWRNASKVSGTRFKICLSGKYDVGKSSIFLRLQGQEFSEDKPTCQTSTFELTDIEDETIEYSIWDTNGFEQHDSLTMGDHYRNAHCIVFVYDTSDMSSLEYLQYELESIEKNHYAPSSKYVLIQNKIDLKESKHISYNKQKEFIKNSVLRSKIDLFAQTSAKMNEGILELFKEELPELLCMPEKKGKNLSAFDRFIAESLENINRDLDNSNKKKKKKKKKLKCKTM